MKTKLLAFAMAFAFLTTSCNPVTFQIVVQVVGKGIADSMIFLVVEKAFDYVLEALLGVTDDIIIIPDSTNPNIGRREDALQLTIEVNSYGEKKKVTIDIPGNTLIYQRGNNGAWELTDQALSFIQSRTNVAECQLCLQFLKYKVGEADGILGPRTKAAIMKFQKDHNMVQTGMPDKDTLMLLRAIMQNK
jgi:hypothetical protein